MSFAGYQVRPLRSISARRWHSFILIAIAFAIGLVAAGLPLLWALAILALAAFILLSVVQPLIPLAAALITGPFGAYENIIFGDLVLESGQLLFLFSVFSWLVNRAIRKPGKLLLPPLVRPLALFIFISAVTLLTARSFESGIKELAKWIEVGVAVLMVLDLGLRQRDAHDHLDGTSGSWAGLFRERWIIVSLLAAGLVQAWIGIWQFGFQEKGPDHFIILERFYRGYGTFMQPNPFGGFMGLTASLALGSFIGSSIYTWNQWRVKRSIAVQDYLWMIFLGGSSLMLLAALVMSWSRGAWLGFALGLVLFGLFLSQRRRYGLMLLGLGVILIFGLNEIQLLPSSLVGRAADLGGGLRFEDVRGVHIDEGNYAEVERLAHWQAALEMARSSLWLGVGFGNYESVYPDHQLLNWPFALGHAHNYYLNLVAETGLIGLAAYLILWGYIFYQLLFILRTSSWPHRGVALGLLAAWTAMSVHHLVDKLYVNNMYIFMGVMLGLQQILHHKYDNADH